MKKKNPNTQIQNGRYLVSSVAEEKVKVDYRLNTNLN